MGPTLTLLSTTLITSWPSVKLSQSAPCLDSAQSTLASKETKNPEVSPMLSAPPSAHSMDSTLELTLLPDRPTTLLLTMDITKTCIKNTPKTRLYTNRIIDMKINSPKIVLLQI